MKCPECGIDDYTTRDHDRVVKEHLELARQYKEMRAHHGLREAEWDLQKITLRESMKSLQRKTSKQAQVINRLEERLRNLKQRPYEEEE